MTRVGIIGGGQLGQMLGRAARALPDVDCLFLDPASSPPAASEGRVISAAFDDRGALAKLVAESDVITYEFENVPVAALQDVAGTKPVYPPLTALAEAQDRAREKALFESLDIPLPRWAAIDGEQQLRDAARDIGLPLVVKTRRFGYDGKGQYVLHTLDDVATAMSQLPPQALVAEQWVPFDREVSAIAVRAASGELAFYPLTENRHRDGILRCSLAPAGPATLTERANDYLERLVTKLDYVGVLALELFVAGDRLLANEFAPRVHNSGHWTIEGAATSQFENHLRAILDLPLGDCAAQGHAGMVNLIGAMPTSPQSLLDSGVHLHDYGKAPRNGRKLGHLTIVEADAAARDQRLERLQAMLAN